jgi:Tetratricopeptide repeat
MKHYAALLIVLMTVSGRASSADVVTAFVPGKEWQASITLDGFEPFDVQSGPKTILGGSTKNAVTITVLVESVKPGTTASEARAVYGRRYAGGLDEKEGVETTEVGDVAVIIYKSALGELCGFNGYLTMEDMAFDVHLSVDMTKQTRESVLAVLKSFKVESTAECVEMAALMRKLARLNGDSKAIERDNALSDFAAKFPGNSWAHAALGEEYLVRGLYQKAAKAYSVALRNHRTQPIVNPLSLWKCYDGLGMCLGIQGKYDRSLVHLKRGLEVAYELEDKKLIAASDYNLACWHAESGHTEKSVEYLRKAIRLNEKKRKEAERDSSFRGIREEPAFRKLIAGR